MVNELLDDWVRRPKNLEDGLMLVAIGNSRIPVSNQLCPLCNKGWGSPSKFAVKDNKVYHKLCLQVKGLMTDEVISE